MEEVRSVAVRSGREGEAEREARHRRASHHLIPDDWCQSCRRRAGIQEAPLLQY